MCSSAYGRRYVVPRYWSLLCSVKAQPSPAAAFPDTINSRVKSTACIQKNMQFKTTLFALILGAMPLLASAAKLKDVPAKQYIMIDYVTGQVLAEQDPDARVSPASITKLMAVYVALSQIKGGKFSLEDEVKIGPSAVVKGNQSRMWLANGDKVPLYRLLQGIVVVSGNDASIAVAEHISGSEKTFVALMNKTAKAMGLSNTHFTNVHGLDHPEHYMSARDIATLARNFLHHFRKEYQWFKIRELTHVSKWGNPVPQFNTNKLLSVKETERPYYDGLKTGRTDKAGYCLVASAFANKNRFITVVLGAKSDKQRNRATKKLMKYGFANFSAEPVLKKNTAMPKKVAVWKGNVREVEVGAKNTVFLTLPRGKKAKVTQRFRLHKNLHAPAPKGTEAGRVEILVDGKVMAKAPLFTLVDVEEGSFVNRTTDHFRLMHK